MPSDCWLTNGSHYRCPFCFQLYQPWKAKSGQSGRPWINAQKIMAIRKAATSPGAPGKSSSAASTGPLDPTVSVTVQSMKAEEHDFDFYLCEWADTTTQRLMDELKSIYADLPKTLASRSTDPGHRGRVRRQ
jgi:hypothetical protein